jgi:hypothetical protein
MTDCFSCRYCHWHDDLGRIWRHRHNRDARTRCADYEREAGSDG